MEIYYPQTLVVVTDLYIGHGSDDQMMGPTDPDYIDLLGIVIEVDHQNQTATVETKRHGRFATVPCENLITLAELCGKDYDDPEEALRDFLLEVIVRIACSANATSRALTETLKSFSGITR